MPGVGENLGDHHSPRVVARAKNTETINNMVTGTRLAGKLLRWAARKPSVLGLSAAIVYAFGKSDPGLEQPDYTIIFTPASYLEGKLGSLDTYPGMSCGAWQMRPESTGYVRIKSADPAEAPVIQPNYLAAEKDRQVLLSAIRKGRDILASMLAAPGTVFDAVPRGTMKHAEFMRKTGAIQRAPAAWKDVFFPEAYDLPGD